jgi:two-component system cell cycle sensor histidine kinase/response regulator CckA
MSVERKPVSVLIVDDEPAVRQFVRRVLNEGGYQTRVAGGGPEALKMVAESGGPDLLLTDVNMPDMDGNALAATLRATNPDLKVLYLTGFSDSLFKQHSTLWEGEAFLDKPCSVKGLLEAVALILYGRIVPRSAHASVLTDPFKG